MSHRIRRTIVPLLALAAAACSNVVADPAPRATQVPNVRCFDQPPTGSPGLDTSYNRPMFFLFCMQSP